MSLKAINRFGFTLIMVVLSTAFAFSQKQSFVETNNTFGLNFYKATKPDSSNFFISPFSLNVALALTSEGARGSTLSEINRLLVHEGITRKTTKYQELISQTVNVQDSAFQDCIKWSIERPKGNALYLANSLWINEDFKVDEDFKKVSRLDYFSDVFSFKKESIMQTNQNLNQWIAEKTNNKIIQIAEIDSDTQLGIINAIYFLGEWALPFNPKKTKVKNFHTIEKEKIKVSFLNEQSHYRYFENDDAQFIEIPYSCNQFSMIVALPGRRYAINELEGKLDNDYMSNTINNLKTHEVIFSMPKFKIETELIPKDAIIKMGFPEMFSDVANFSGMSSSRLKIGKIVHKTFIEVNEKTTEAAATTMVEMVVVGYGGGEPPPPPPPPKVFNANHPFIFFIIDNRTKATLFVGRYAK